LLCDIETLNRTALILSPSNQVSPFEQFYFHPLICIVTTSADAIAFVICFGSNEDNIVLAMLAPIPEVTV
jgi:hypothetical protein